MKRRARGFSLIEFLIVVAIILIIAAMAIPNLMPSKMTANESAAVEALRTLNFFTDRSETIRASSTGSAGSAGTPSSEKIEQKPWNGVPPRNRAI